MRTSYSNPLLVKQKNKKNITKPKLKKVWLMVHTDHNDQLRTFLRDLIILWCAKQFFEKLLIYELRPDIKRN